MKRNKQNIDPTKGKLNLIKLSFKPSRIKKKALRHSKGMSDYIRKLFDKGTFYLQEQSILLLLDENSHAIGYYPLSKGHKESCSIDERFILQIVLLAGAEAFVIAHNHPDGINQPSEADITSVVSLKHKADLFSIRYMDDLVITKDSYFSFAENGLVIGMD